ncbi:MAG: sulfur oxidation c-type cytochrome SoxX [Geminicoccaceae bacterium]
MLAVAALWPAAATGDTLAPYRLVDGGIPESLTGAPGDPARGRALVADRRVGLCLLCHSGPFPEEPLQGELAPDLTATGDRLSAAQLRLRLVDSRSLDVGSIMPSYYRVDGLERVGEAWRGRPILSAGQIEDVVAFLVTLRSG